MPLKKREVIQHPSQFTPLISRYLRHLRLTQAGCETLDQYLSLIHQLLTASPSIVPLACLLEILGSVPDLLAEKFTDKLSWFKVINFTCFYVYLNLKIHKRVSRLLSKTKIMNISNNVLTLLERFL